MTVLEFIKKYVFADRQIVVEAIAGNCNGYMTDKKAIVPAENMDWLAAVCPTVGGLLCFRQDDGTFTIQVTKQKNP